MDARPAAHRHTAAAWDIIAESKYRGEFAQHVADLRAGRHNLLEVELRTIGELIPHAHVIHLQCSHGFDALGLLNLGAQSVLGVDISAQMIEQARAKAAAFRPAAATFIEADAVDLPAELDSTGDLIYTGRGALPWLLDLAAWAQSARRVLKPGGHLFLLEGHPLDTLWERSAEGLRLRPGVSYFDEVPKESPGFPAEVVDRAVGSERPRMLERQWRPSEVVEALLAADFELKRFAELPVMFWDQFPHWPEALSAKLPHSYLILARRPVDRRDPSA